MTCVGGLSWLSSLLLPWTTSHRHDDGVALPLPAVILRVAIPLVMTLLLGLVTKAIIMARWKQGSQQATYNSWIERARHERDTKARELDKLLYDNDKNDENGNGNDDDDESYAFLTVAETFQAIVEQQTLDPVEHVLKLARRCRKYAYGDMDNGVNAIAEECYDQALHAAREIQRILETSIKTKNSDRSNHVFSPLLGVPISVKEAIGVQGCYSTGGLACRLATRKVEDALIVQVLRRRNEERMRNKDDDNDSDDSGYIGGGVIPLCTGNVPQLMMLPESYNHIWGRTRNPWNLSRTAGGSSGGDAALVAMGCVPLALASDVAGSIRGPACFNGIVGFKPTPGRVSTMGCMKPRRHDKSGTSIVIPAVNGPLCRTVDCAARFCQAAWTKEMFEKDLHVAPFPFNDKVYQSPGKLVFGYFETDDWFEPCATSKRALQETIHGLTKAGHTCQPFKPPTCGWYKYALLVAINSADGHMKSFVDALEGEAFWSQYYILLAAANLPNFIRSIVHCFRLLDERRRHLIKQARYGGASAWDYGQMTADLLNVQQSWSDAFVHAGIDALLFPGMPVPAILHDTSGELTSINSYMFLANLLRWPSGTVPVTTVRPGREEEYRLEDLPENQRDHIAKLVAKCMEGSAGMPISVSVMTPPYRDEMCLRAMKQVEAVVKFAERPQAYKDHVSS
jgi:fatty acid amide hydrolase